MRRNCLVGLGFGVLWLLMLGSAIAQSDRGTIAGSILDSSGAAVGGASITITGVYTGNTYKSVSTAEGVYRVADIEPAATTSRLRPRVLRHRCTKGLSSKSAPRRP